MFSSKYLEQQEVGDSVYVGFRSCLGFRPKRLNLEQQEVGDSV